MKKQQVLDILKKKFPKLTSLTDVFINHLLSSYSKQYEYNLLNDFVLPEQVDCSFDDIGGLDDVKEEIRVFYNQKCSSIIHRIWFCCHCSNQSSFMQTICQNYQKESYYMVWCDSLKKMSCRTSWNWQNHDCQGDCQGIECCFSLCSVVCFLFDNHDHNRSSINNMWLGESEKIIDSLFSLAKKLSPCILFIDEADILLGSRKSFQNEVSLLSSELVTQASSSIKGEFLQLWDGLTSSMTEGDGQKSEILIIAATYGVVFVWQEELEIDLGILIKPF